MMKRTAIVVFFFLAVGHAITAQENFYTRLSGAAIELTGDTVNYDPSYFSISYPDGDVPANKGVCTDVIIRAYRKLGIDLQKEVHEDMKSHFELYPKLWGLTHTDTNIDHRRVPNLMTFFNRFGEVKKKSEKETDYEAGDIVCWDLGNGITHIGIVVSPMAKGTRRHLIVHNIGSGQVMEDCLFHFKIIGHYRYKK